MNHIYKVIWNKAKHCYTVVSEIAKSHSDSTKRVRVGTTAALMAVAVLTGFAMPAQAAVSIGTDGTVKAEAADINALNNLLKNGVTKNKDGSVTVGGLTVKKNGEVSVNSPDVVYGKNAKIIWDSNNTMGQISIGNNATAITGRGGQERAFAYDGDVNHAAGAIAIGANTYARTGSIMIGSHVYKGNMGDVTGIDTDSFNTDSNGAYGFTVNSTTIGTNSFTRGNLATTIGDYNIQSGKSRGYGWNSLLYGAQNFGATVIGALNSNESQSAGSGMSGIANSIVGVANKVNSSNGTLVFGAGNEVTHSLSDIYGVDDTTSLRDAKKAQDALKNAVAESDAGGAVLAIGGANKADWAQKSQLIGVGNTLTGASSAVSEYNMINGYKNEVTNATHTSIIGSNNKAKNIKSTIVMGDHNTLEGRENVISLGNNNTVDANDAVAIGNGTTVKAESGVAIGVDSVADRVAGSEKGALGAFAPDTIPTGEESTWTSTKGAVSVGDTVNNITRQITDVAAGSEDTDAVNVAQLKQVASQAEKANQGWNLSTNGAAATNVAPGDSVDFSGDDNVSVSNKETRVTVALNKDVKLHSATFEDTVINANGLTIGGGTSGLEFSKTRVSVGGQQIHDVADGEAEMDAVNMSQLKEKTAASKTTVSDGTNTKVTSTVAKDGHTDYQVNLNKDLTGIESISNGSKGQSKIVLNEAYTGMAYGETNVVLMNNGVYLNGKVNVDKAGQIHNVTAGTADEDAVNVSQLKKQAAASKTTVSDGTNTTVTSTVAEDGHTDYKVNLNKDLTGIESMTNGLSSIRMGNGGTVTINNRVTIDQSGKISGVAAGEVKEGSTDAVNGSQLKGVENKADKNAENIQKNTEAIAKNTADISKNAEAISKNTENIKNNSKAIAENAKNIQKNTEAIAKNTADISKNTEAIGKLDERVTSVEEVAKKHTTVSTDDKNVQISEDTNKDGGKDYKVSLNKDLNLSSVTTGDTKMDTNGVTVKDVSLTKDGLSIGNKTYVSDKGLNANDQKVTNVAAGDLSEKSTDAVNGSQLFATNQQVVQNAQSISKLGNRINKVGAGAAALAALHPLDFDPDDKWDIAAGYGNYNGENAAAIGAYYRPNEDTMFSVGGSFGNGENMVNAGVSLKLGQGNHVSTSKVAMAKEIKDLRKEMEGLKSALLDANAGKKLDTSKLQLFPDVPKNHWAYEYVSTLKGNGMLTGYPDGEFKGDRPMTRYEFATMLYKAMLEGATLSDKILKEFAPELERFTVDTVHQDKDGKPTVERVRTVKAAK